MSDPQSKDKQITSKVEVIKDTKEVKDITQAVVLPTQAVVLETAKAVVVKGADSQVKSTKEVSKQVTSDGKTITKTVTKTVVKGEAAKVGEVSKVAKTIAKSEMTKEVSEIKTNLDAMMITEEGSPVNADGTKLVFKMDEDSKSDKGSNEGLETIEYIKIGQNSNTLLNDDFALGGNYKVE
jgi:hypothetical protein